MSPTYREKQVSILSNLIPQVMQVDPEMGGKLVEFMLELSDASMDIKNFIRNRNAEKAQAAQEQAELQKAQQAEASIFGKEPSNGGMGNDVDSIMQSIGGSVANVA